MTVSFQELAQKELNENDDTRDRDVALLRKKLSKKKGLRARTDYEFLVRFLRARKFDVDLAYELVKNYYKVRKRYRWFFDQLTPSALKHVIDDGVTFALDQRDKQGRFVMTTRLANWDPTLYPIEDIMRVAYLSLEKIVENEDVQLCGLITIDDLGSMNLSHALHVTPSKAQMWQNMTLNAFPLRIKAVHYVNTPNLVDILRRIVLPLLPKKFQSRMHFHLSDYSQALDEDVGLAVLPPDYGGTNPMTIAELSKKWGEYLLSCEEDFADNLEYGYLDE